MTFDGQSVIEADDLPHIVGMLAPDTEVRVEIIRKGKRRALDVVVGTLDDDRLAMAGSSDSDADRLGLNVDEVSAEQLATLRACEAVC